MLRHLRGHDRSTQAGSPGIPIETRKFVYAPRIGRDNQAAGFNDDTSANIAETRGGILPKRDAGSYRGNLFFDLVKTTVIRLAFAMGWELRRKNVAAVAITPGFLRSEIMLDHFGVTEANWRDAGNKDPNFLQSETPLYVERAIAALAADENLMKKSSRAFSSWGLSEEYEFADADGSRPHWGRHAQKKFGDCMESCDAKFYEYWFGGVVEKLFPNWP